MNSIDLSGDPKTVKSLRYLWRLILEDEMSVACFKSGSLEMAGINLLHIMEKDDFIDKSNTKVERKMNFLCTNEFDCFPFIF